ncbi:hypothetical protein H6G27_16645 [Nostoc linckia FACHB-104]|nr:hypothetical protein [Nostoc linckia FACHB-104]
MKEYKKTPNLAIVPFPTKSATTAIAPLQFPKDNISDEWERLLSQVQCINQMAAQLEEMILEFKAIASKLQEKGKPHNSTCEYLAVTIPWVRKQPDESFILTNRSVDLFQAEKDAQQLAQQLRQQSRSKELRSQ